MKGNKRLIALLLSVVFIITACFSMSCTMVPSNNNSNNNNAPSFSKSRYEYDIRVGGDFLIFGIENLTDLISVKINDNLVTPTNYTVGSDHITLKASYMSAFSIGTFVFLIETANGKATTYLKLISSAIGLGFTASSYNYDISRYGNFIAELTVDASITAVEINDTLISTDDYEYENKILTIKEVAFLQLGLNLGTYNLTAETEQGQISTKIQIVSTHNAPDFSSQTYIYDLAVGGYLDIAVNLFDAKTTEVVVSGEKIDANYFDGYLYLEASAVNQIGKGEHVLTIATEYGTSSVRLNIINTAIFDNGTIKTYTYGVTTSIEYQADFGVASVSKVLLNGKALSTDAYSYQSGKFTLYKKALDLIYGEMAFTVVLSNLDEYEVRVNSNVLFYTDYDYTTIHDLTVSSQGVNNVYMNSYNVSIVDGFSGKGLKYTKGIVSNSAGESIYTIRNTLLETSYWYGVEMPAGKNIVVEFDYASYGTTSSDKYIFQRVQNGQVINEQFSTPGDGVKRSAKFTVSTDQLKVICLNYTARTTDSQYLIIDNFRVSLADK
ncbi:MAG: hypothetical protein J6V68_04115 [Clostridia bacterium]|nr:hypothetical protein [Clostridia bacterium]